MQEFEGNDISAVRGERGADLIDATPLQDPAGRARSAELSLLTDLSDAPSAPPGWSLERRLGSGGYGDVWLARERRTGRAAAIKFLRGRGIEWASLSREVERLAALDASRNIVDLIDVGWDVDPPYFIMEFLPRGSLDRTLEGGPLKTANAVRLIRGVLEGLVHAHGSGILHCDLKPANVLLDAGDEPRLCDFGQSRRSIDRSPSFGTLFYMAPEQAASDAVPDVRWDVYAVGALLYQLLTGAPPHRTEEAEAELREAETIDERLATYRRIVTTDGAADLSLGRHVDRPLAEIVRRCLSVDPDARFPTAQAVRDALDARDRESQRRPMLVLGLVGPMLLLLSMVPFFLTTMKEAVSTARENAVEQAQGQIDLTARLLSRSFDRELDERARELDRMASDSEVVDLTKSAASMDWDETAAADVLAELRSLLAQRANAIKERRLVDGLEPDQSWFLVSAGEHRHGIQQWRYGPQKENEKTLGKSYAFRDYFHGQGVQYDREDDLPDDLGVVQQTHVSLAYRSEATWKYMFAISTPVRDPESGDVIAVLARTTHLGQLLDEFSRESRESKTSVLAVVDARDGELLDHQWMTAEHLDLNRIKSNDHPWILIEKDGRTGTEFRVLVPPKIERGVSAAFDEAARRVQSGVPDKKPVREAAYFDPFRRAPFGAAPYEGRWLAAFAPIEDTGWIALVQQRYDEVVRPVEQMRRSFARYGIAALICGAALILVLWYFVSQALTGRVLFSRHDSDAVVS
ncbi:serine/threonine protein kinase [Stratiformator vulcanicus]|uniref:Serine/threonine-protein kinase PrkC n=1 Tax=Stratiformator vulcanicus TaxID=2527980 RepID=A0A517R2E2_9PLAN|nr:serine/threonine-protein kinase [Stratiformator vulcanicus]QDT38047.1 Serine/threonine-protein kinase PrkC [Stratiformator vulcanicus]